MSQSDIQPFKIDIPKEEVERLKRKLEDTRLPGREVVPGAGGRYGTPPPILPLIDAVHSRLTVLLRSNLQVGKRPIRSMENGFRLVSDPR